MQRTFSLTITISTVVTGLEKPLAKTNRTYNGRKLWHNVLTMSQIKRVKIYGTAGML
jgi:hypothetical protein